jgi:hypothetical protein
MTFTLKRTDFTQNGIFSILTSDKGDVFHCLEHAYLQPDGTYKTKIPVGTFTCVRGPHRLHGMTTNFETFEISGVVGHDNLLFHWGNYNKDSEGCVLVGTARVGDMVTNSRAAFGRFMGLIVGPSFSLVVTI